MDETAVSAAEVQSFRTELATSNATLLTTEDVQRFVLPTTTTSGSNGAADNHAFPDTWTTLDEQRLVRLAVDVRLGLQFTLWHEDIPGAVFFDAHQAQLCPFLMRCVTLFVKACNHADIVAGDPRWISGDLYMEALATRDAAGFIVDEDARLYHLFYIRGAPGSFASEMLSALLLRSEQTWDDAAALGGGNGTTTSVVASSGNDSHGVIAIVPFQKLQNLHSPPVLPSSSIASTKSRRQRAPAPLLLRQDNPEDHLRQINDLRHTPYRHAPTHASRTSLSSSLQPYARNMFTNRLYHPSGTRSIQVGTGRPPSMTKQQVSSSSVSERLWIPERTLAPPPPPPETRPRVVATLGHITRTSSTTLGINNHMQPPPPPPPPLASPPPQQPRAVLRPTPPPSRQRTEDNHQQFPCLLALQQFAARLTPSLVVPPLRDMHNDDGFWPDSPHYSDHAAVEVLDSGRVALQ